MGVDVFAAGGWALNSAPGDRPLKIRLGVRWGFCTTGEGVRGLAQRAIGRRRPLGGVMLSVIGVGPRGCRATRGCWPKTEWGAHQRGPDKTVARAAPAGGDRPTETVLVGRAEAGPGRFALGDGGPRRKSWKRRRKSAAAVLGVVECGGALRVHRQSPCGSAE